MQIDFLSEQVGDHYPKVCWEMFGNKSFFQVCETKSFKHWDSENKQSHRKWVSSIYSQSVSRSVGKFVRLVCFHHKV